MDTTRLRFLFQKELKNSDVSSLRRMILPKKAAEAHLPALDSKEGIFISMEDLDGLHVWSFKYRYWPNNNSRMYVLENTGDFVNVHGLQLGDFIMVYQDHLSHNYVIQARKASEEEEEEEEDVYVGLARIDESKVDDDICLVRDFNMDATKSSGPSYYPVMDGSFVYDTTKLTNDTPLDFLGGSMTSTTSSYCTFGSFDSFGFSLDDFC
ncbi:PREDICTED: B3 domain-containing transcription factor FUS3-like [Tarenaya hassleriana]|uniref:B3 domain-containing transcription factor FUS3-like n=1 Tax=Tarenaya hassleriana TaxID=28532 RepID=UPI00053C4983|nr:PREDICTED: B3 domain-containing transcription factor FUS3-like [Tarenaya hassleriana]